MFATIQAQARDAVRDMHQLEQHATTAADGAGEALAREVEELAATSADNTTATREAHRASTRMKELSGTRCELAGRFRV